MPEHASEPHFATPWRYETESDSKPYIRIVAANGLHVADVQTVPLACLIVERVNEHSTWPHLHHPEPMCSLLIQLKPSLIVHADSIERVARCGNYTEVLLKGDGEFASRHHQIWDESKEVWNRIVDTISANRREHAPLTEAELDRMIQVCDRQ